jgi:hypothetical protein
VGGLLLAAAGEAGGVPRRPERTRLATSTRIVVTRPDRRLEIDRTDRDQESAEATVEVVVDGEVFFSRSFRHRRAMAVAPSPISSKGRT